jgi:hypothetical protein
MTRSEILDWLRAHRESVHGDPEAVLDHAEHEARRRAAEAAWLHAKRIAEGEVARWKGRSRGLHAREDWVAREFCHELARELRHLEPHPERESGEEERWVDGETLAALEREAREQLRLWIRELVGSEEHRVWGEVVRFTDARARSLVSEGAISTEERWERTHSYAETAARLAAILAQDYEEHAHPARD